MKTRIDIERIQELRAELRAFNRLDLREVEFHQGGTPIEVPSEAIDRFQFTGLANMDFVDMGFWKEDIDKSPMIIQLWGYRVEGGPDEATVPTNG